MNQRDQFIRDLEAKVDRLVKAMHPEGKEPFQLSRPLAWMDNVARAAEELRNHFERVRLPLLMELSLDGQDIGKWESRLREKLTEQRTRLKEETKRLEGEVRRESELFGYTDLDPSYGWTKDNRLYVIVGHGRDRKGLILDAILDLDIQEWLKELRLEAKTKGSE